MATVFLKAHIDDLVAKHITGNNNYDAYCDLLDDITDFYGGDRFDFDDAKQYLLDKHGITFKAGFNHE